MTKLFAILSLGLFIFGGCQSSPPIVEVHPLPYPFDDRATEYLIALPASETQGTLVLFAGFGQTAQQVREETHLMDAAAEQGLACVVLPIGYHLWLDSTFQEHLTRNLREITAKFTLPRDKGAVFGGFSAGGTIALRYIEGKHAAPNQAHFPIKGAFMVDSPLDLAKLHAYCEQELATGIYDGAIQEARFVKNLLESQLGGSPKAVPDTYTHFSPFTPSMDESAHASLLAAIPIRSYHDADEEWYLKERGRNLADTHLPIAQELVAMLQSNGNEDAEIVLANGKGYRSDGSRHPHSWSIVAVGECVAWAKRCLAVQ